MIKHSTIVPIVFGNRNLAGGFFLDKRVEKLSGGIGDQARAVTSAGSAISVSSGPSAVVSGPNRHRLPAASTTGSIAPSASTETPGAEVSSSGPNIPPTFVPAAAMPLPLARSVVG